MADILNCIHGAFMQIYTFGMYDRLKEVKEEIRKETFAKKVVAAGDPAQKEHKKAPEANIPATVSYKGQEIRCNDFDSWTVDGYSMSPEGINNGDVLLCKPVGCKERESVGLGKYVVIKVDTAYYEYKKKTLSFQTKLRKTLMKVSGDMDVETLVLELKKVDDSVLLTENEKNLRKKFRDIKGYYKTEDLMLSLTYREGALRYSFHPVSLIESVAEYVLSKQEDSWNVNKL